MQRYGLDYAVLSKLNPRLVYCAITGFGQTGPYSKRAGYDFVVQAMGGLDEHHRRTWTISPRRRTRQPNVACPLPI